MSIVSNTSPISNLIAIGHLSLLQQVYGDIIIPKAVADEVAKAATTYPQAALISTLPWISVQPISDEMAVARFQSQKLDAGEAEAIVLALELKAELLIVDEQLGRAVATREGLNITGLMGVLLEAKSRAFISTVKPIVDDLMIQAGFRVSAKLYQNVLQLADEDAD